MNMFSFYIRQRKIPGKGSVDTPPPSNPQYQGVNIQENFEKSGKVPGTLRVPKQPFYVPASP